MNSVRVYITDFDTFLRIWILLVILLLISGSFFLGKKTGKDEIREDLAIKCEDALRFDIKGRDGIYQCFKIIDKKKAKE